METRKESLEGSKRKKWRVCPLVAPQGNFRRATPTQQWISCYCNCPTSSRE